MTAFVRTGFIDNYRNLDPSKQLLNEASAGGPSDNSNNQKSLMTVLRQPDFIITGTTDSNTAAASSPVLSLNGTAATDGRVQFPADTEREIVVATLAVNGANRFRYTCRYRVLGSATAPTLKGNQVFLTNCFAFVEATTDGSTTTVETANCLGPEWWDGAAPLIGAFSTGQATISWLGGNAPVGSLIPIGANHAATTPGTVANDKFVSQSATSLTNGTTQLETVGGTTDFALGLSAGTVQATAFITPPVNSALVINTSPAPDEVVLTALGLSSDVVTWRFEVYIGPMLALPLL